MVVEIRKDTRPTRPATPPESISFEVHADRPHGTTTAKPAVRPVEAVVQRDRAAPRKAVALGPVAPPEVRMDQRRAAPGPGLDIPAPQVRMDQRRAGPAPALDIPSPQVRMDRPAGRTPPAPAPEQFDLRMDARDAPSRPALLPDGPVQVYMDGNSVWVPDEKRSPHRKAP